MLRRFAFTAQRSAQRAGHAHLRYPLHILTLSSLMAAACSYAGESGGRSIAFVSDPTLPPSAAASFSHAGAAAPSPTDRAALPNTPPVTEALDAAPPVLSQTGLYSDTRARTLAANVQVFSPAYPLWSDAAGKLRWISLPEGAQIDTSDMDVWKLPIGTKLWKEFEHQGHVIETRYMAKFGPSESDWVFIAYHWNPEQTDAAAVPQGVPDADGSKHDIPSTAACKQCHTSQPMAALGFSAVQLAKAGPGLTLETLTSAGKLSVPPSGPLTIPGDPVTAQALGYLHGNCGGCHNDRATQNFGVPETKIVFWQSANQLSSLEQTTTYVNLVTKTQGNLTRLQHGLNRMKVRDPYTQMPPLGTEVVDTQGVALIETWLTQLQTQLSQSQRP
jgi:hypothetical protein